MNLYKVQIKTKDNVRLGFLLPATDMREAIRKGLELGLKWKGFLLFVDEIRNGEVEGKVSSRPI